MAWTGKILRVDLAKGTCTPEPLNMQWARDYVGQRGLATKYFTEEVDAKVDPLSPANKLIWATGPLTGTMASTGGRYSVITKGALTGAIACSNSGGYWGAELKMAGWDMIIFEGKSPKPVYLLIQDDTAQLLDAGWLWGKSVWETEPAIKAKHQDPQIRVSSIGRAGETGCMYAGVINDLHRAAGRSGVGTVMGSKNLKAIAVRGTKGVGNIRDPKAFMQAATAAKKVLAANAVTGQGLPKFGTQVLMNVINEVGALPTRNHRDVQFDGAKDISAEAMHQPRKSDGKPNLVTNQACFGCTIACGRVSKIDETHYTVVNKPKYWGASGGLEYEAAWALGATRWEMVRGVVLPYTRSGVLAAVILPRSAPSWNSTRWACSPRSSLASKRPSVRSRRSPTSRKSPARARASARRSRWARSGSPPNTVIRTCR